MKEEHILYLIIGALLIIIASMLLRCCGGNGGGVSITTDTIVVKVTDTIAVERERIEEHTNVVSTEVVDTFVVVRNDTIFCELPVERKEYRDTITTDTTATRLFIAYSGVLASLDTIGIENEYEQRTIKITERVRKGWSHGVYINAGVGYDAIHNAPYVGIGIGYGFGYGWMVR